jgi:uncharacterized protein (TIGR02145 family)
MRHFLLPLVLVLLCSLSHAQGPCPGIPTVTYSGKIYNTVQIGSQCWLKENLDVGTMIDSMQEQSNNDIIEKYCDKNSLANCSLYGGFYQWAEAVQYKNGATDTSLANPVYSGNIQGICPSGWHIPTQSEFDTLIAAVNSDGNALKAIGQGIESGVGTNLSGFSALLAGDRYYDKGWFGNFGLITYFWSSTEYTAGTASYISLDFNVGYITMNSASKTFGFTVRCVNDNTFSAINDNNSSIKTEYNLLQNYPNPFNPSTTISFSLPERSKVVLSIYNELGQKVAVLFNGEKTAGLNNVQWNANGFSSGVYFYVLSTENYRAIKKLLLMK